MRCSTNSAVFNTNLLDKHRGFPLRKLQIGADIHVTYGRLSERARKRVLHDAAPIDGLQEKKGNFEDFEDFEVASKTKCKKSYIKKSMDSAI